MPRIFISYRREDSADYAAEIFDAFADYFGPENVFKDIEGIKLGDEFRAIIERELTHSDIALSIIGPKWLNIEDSHGNRRLDNPADFVRIENEMAIRHQLNGDIRLIPVLVAGAAMPPANRLPPSLTNLPYINGAVLRDAHFEEDLERLIRHIDEHSSITGSIAVHSPAGKPRQRSMLWLAGILSLLLLLVMGYLLFNPFADGSDDSSSDNDNTAGVTSTSETQVAAAPTDTLQIETTIAPSATQTDEPASATFTTEPSPTTIDPGDAEDITATTTPWSPTPSSTDTPTRTSTHTPTETPSYTPTFTLTQMPSLTPTSMSTRNPAFVLAETGVTSNDQWEPFVQEFDGVEMVLVPVGCFRMGSEDGSDNIRPVHDICFDEPFWIDRYEVTQSDFTRLGGTQSDAPAFTGGDLPVENITWLEAFTFCEQREARLPTEAEWEYAASGPNDLVYPWGNEWDPTRLNRDDQRSSTPNTTTGVGSFADGISWVGAYDLSGNVWEWTSTISQDYPYSPDDGRENTTDLESDRAMRGGSFPNIQSVYYQTSNRNSASPTLGNYFYGYVGVRCARSY